MTRSSKIWRTPNTHPSRQSIPPSAAPNQQGPRILSRGESTHSCFARERAAEVFPPHKVGLRTLSLGTLRNRAHIFKTLTMVRYDYVKRVIHIKSPYGKKSNQKDKRISNRIIRIISNTKKNN